MPLYMRLPKLRGFKSHRTKAECVYTGQLDQIKKASIDNDAVFEAGLVSSPNVSVKLLVKGEVSSKKDVKLQSASASAVMALKKTGGSFIKTDRMLRASKKITPPSS